MNLITNCLNKGIETRLRHTIGICNNEGKNKRGEIGVRVRKELTLSRKRSLNQADRMLIGKIVDVVSVYEWVKSVNLIDKKRILIDLLTVLIAGWASRAKTRIELLVPKAQKAYDFALQFYREDLQTVLMQDLLALKGLLKSGHRGSTGAKAIELIA